MLRESSRGQTGRIASGGARALEWFVVPMLYALPCGLLKVAPVVDE